MSLNILLSSNLALVSLAFIEMTIVALQVERKKGDAPITAALDLAFKWMDLAEYVDKEPDADNNMPAFHTG